MEATILLCDYAESINGKLYISGGGWLACEATMSAESNPVAWTYRQIERPMHWLFRKLGLM